MQHIETWLITGVTRGIGLALAAAHLGRGGHVIGTARGIPGAELAALATHYPARLQLLSMDVADDNSVRSAAQAVNRPIDVLVSSAAIYGKRHTELRALDFQDMLAAFNTNAIGPLRVAEAFLPQLLKSNRPRIVSLTSLMGSTSRPGPGSFAYRASKAALNKLTQALAEELFPTGVAVAAARPGWVKTDMTAHQGQLTAEESALRLLAVIDAVTPSQSAELFDIDGSKIAW